MTCHYNPFGNGPLNDYGRALSATTISGRLGYDKRVTEDEIANSSGFFMKQSSNDWFRPSFDYRGLLIKKNFEQDNQETEFITMMADLNIVLKFMEDRLIMSGTIGYFPTPKSLENSDEEIQNYISREAYIGYRVNDYSGIYLGLMDKIYGLRVAEHNAYSRSLTNMSYNDQTVGAFYHYATEKIELGASYFIGNTNQEEELRQKGQSVKVDYLLSSKASIGVSVLKSNNDFLDMYMNSFHFKSSAGKGAAIIGELGEVTKESIEEGSIEKNTYALTQVSVNLQRGIFLNNSIEYLKEQNNDFRLRFGPGLQYFPRQRIEFKFDLYTTRTFSEEFSTEDSVDFLSQLHLWF